MKRFFFASLCGAFLFLGALTGCQQEAEPVEEAPAVEAPAATPAEPIDEPVELDTLASDTLVLDAEVEEAPAN